ncbi:hypothetical protein HQQ81_17880 [Microbacteriaceae bacterium VKM Ac-2854]|nr:hypothetical protein [Microbacteriaceae bacterium VKM Ac-2854]
MSTAAELRLRARAFSPDPFPAGSVGDSEWAYAPGDFELLLLHRIVRQGFAANRSVHYAENFPAAPEQRMFRRGDEIVRAAAVRGSGWQVRIDDAWRAAEVRRGGDTAPHEVDEPVVALPVRPLDDGLLDVGVTVLGRPVFRSAEVPVVFSGESAAEARSDEPGETRHDVRPLGDGWWTTVHRLGFRYLRIAGASSVRVEANIRPVPSAGVFLCSDDELNRIWAVAAYTIRLCLQGLVLDGVKRDRMPWIGDQALNTLSNAYAVGDGGIVRDGLVALGRPDGYVNGIADYSLWWLIGRGLHRRYFGGSVPDTVLTELLRECGDDGVFRPRGAGFGGIEGSVLIDWGVRIEPDRDLTALQLLCYWALREAGSPVADVLRRTLYDRAWDASAGAWREYLDDSPSDDPYPNLLAVLSGIGHGDGAVAAIRNGAVRTPWMAAFAVRALAAAGHPEEAVERMRARWAPLLAAGATTFWEDFTAEGESPYEMYGRPFGKSLAHAWGAGPAAILPETVLGIRPESDGWATFSVAPRLGALRWASAVVPIPHGDIVVEAAGGSVTVELPGGTRLLRPEAIGPTRVSWVPAGNDEDPAKNVSFESIPAG